MILWKILFLAAIAGAFKLENVEQMEELLPKVSQKIHPNTTFIMFGCRHGNKNPDHFLNEHPHQVQNFEDTEKELTQFGKLEAYDSGREIREYIGNFVSKKYNFSEAKFYSSSAVACQLTLQIILAGFYPPKNHTHNWIKDAEWVPIPYTINDPMLRMFSVKNCPKVAEVWDPILNDTLEESAAFLDKHKDLLDYIVNNTGWRPSIADVSDLARNLIAMKMYKAKYPDWVEHPTLKGYDKKRFVKEVLEFDELSVQQCAKHEPCRDVIAGVWLQHIVLLLQNATRKDLSYKIVGYATHTEILLSLLKLMHVNIDELSSSAGFLLEYRDQPQQMMRVLIRDPSPIDDNIISPAKYTDRLAKYADSENWIPVHKFLSEVRGKTIWDWELVCGRPGCGLAEAFKILKEAAEDSDIKTKYKADKVNCDDEDDGLGEACEALSMAGLCEKHDATKLLFCRKTCLCSKYL
uniref:ShKT domain-containing protein n=1 Tax=Syphacia muris TaxID=451379 RepID=A0A0N5ASB1_9BILA